MSPSNLECFIPDEFAKETDRMLPDSVDFNRSSLSSSPTTGMTPKSSTSENPYLSSATINSSQKMSLASVSEKSYGVQSAALSSGNQNSSEMSFGNQNSNEIIMPLEQFAPAYCSEELEKIVRPENVVLDQEQDLTAQNKFGLHDKSPCPV